MPDRGPGTGTNYEKREWNTTFRSEIPTGKTGPPFPLFLGIFQWDEPTKRVPFTAEPEIPEILTKWKAPKSSKKSGKKCNVTVKAYCHGERLLVVLRAHSGCISDQTI